MNINFNQNDNTIKKYPVYYKDEEYEIRIGEKQEKSISPYGFTHVDDVDIITIYKVTVETTYFLNLKYNKKKYDEVYSISKNIIDYEVDKENDDYYIELFKKSFERYIEECLEPLELKEKQLNKLEKWDGVI